MKKVLVAGRIPQKGLERLQKEFTVELYDDDDLISEDELKERLNDKDALLSLLSTPAGKETIDSAPNLQVIANFGAGFNNIDFEYAGEKGIYPTLTGSKTPTSKLQESRKLKWGITAHKCLKLNTD